MIFIVYIIFTGDYWLTSLPAISPLITYEWVNNLSYFLWGDKLITRYKHNIKTRGKSLGSTCPPNCAAALLKVGLQSSDIDSFIDFTTLYVYFTSKYLVLLINIRPKI